MIPPFDAAGNLPPGVHEATWDEFVARFGTTPRRLALLAGLKAALDALRAAGCRRAYVDGSFVTAKPDPGDFDGCWETGGVDPALLDPVLTTFDPGRRTQKAKYGGELFFAHAPADPAGTRFVDFFQRDRSGQPRGIVALDPGALP
ncbi:MAG TPA: hypothetical protein VG370_09365 [Chloroflexota bacterium]|nr:hypothetical protein [Chloroflexota bacterium]